MDEGRSFLPEKGVILSAGYKTLYEFPYMTLEMLREEADRQFGNDELTEQEKTKFHVE